MGANKKKVIRRARGNKLQHNNGGNSSTLAAQKRYTIGRPPTAFASGSESDVGVPSSSVQYSLNLASSSNQTANRISTEQMLRRLCFCNYGPNVCESDHYCIKHDKAACFYAVRQEFDADLNAFELHHMFGCAPLEIGSDGSHLTCNARRSIHSKPYSIACCYEGNYCNQNLSVPEFPFLEHPIGGPNGQQYQNSLLTAAVFLICGFLIGILLLAFAVLSRHFCKKGRAKKLMDILYKDTAVSVTTNGGGTMTSNNALESGAGAHLLITFAEDGTLPSNQNYADDSGSGSGGLTLNQRTIAMDLQMLEIFARGRYGELRKAVYRGSLVAVKVFYTTEEESWRNEREIYQTQMLNHENILQYVAADIVSSLESLTQMMLITDYHSIGSLYDYLRDDSPLSLQEALELAFSTISGIEHLHNPVRGTGGRRKPEIVHRDVKSKNVLVKRPGVCCIADFGLAVRLEDGEILPERVNVQVGTKRYMAPEILSRTLNVQNFDEFKFADIYSFSLVLWEILNRIQNTTEEENSPAGRAHQRLMSRSSSSGIASGSDRTFAVASSLVGSVGFSQQHFPIRPNFASEMGNNNSNNALLGGASSGADSAFAGGRTANPSTKTHHHQLSSPSASAFDDVVGAGGRWHKGGNENEVECRPQQQQQQKRAIMLPFQSEVETDPSFELMREIVCEKKIRPRIEPEWTNLTNPLLKAVCELMTECWSEEPRSRHTALKVKKELGLLVALLFHQKQRQR